MRAANGGGFVCAACVRSQRVRADTIGMVCHTLGLEEACKDRERCMKCALGSPLAAHGRLRDGRPIGFDKASGKVSLQKPKIAVEKSIIDSLDGISIGANGFVFATDIRIMLGLGIPAANAGPYARLTTSVGLTVGSDLGIVKCRQATVVISCGGGVGLSAAASVVSGINAVLEKLGVKQKVKEDSGKDAVLEEVYNQTFTSPEKAICK